MGKGRRRSSGLQVPLSARDDDDTIADQWAALRQAFLAEGQVGTVNQLNRSQISAIFGPLLLAVDANLTMRYLSAIFLTTQIPTHFRPMIVAVEVSLIVRHQAPRFTSKYTHTATCSS